MKQERRHGRRLLEIGKDILIVLLVLVNVTLAIMCLPTKTLTQTKWLASALRPFAGLFGLNEAELTYTRPSSGSTITGAAQKRFVVKVPAATQVSSATTSAMSRRFGSWRKPACKPAALTPSAAQTPPSQATNPKASGTSFGVGTAMGAKSVI